MREAGSVDCSAAVLGGSEPALSEVDGAHVLARRFAMRSEVEERPFRAAEMALRISGL